jgi:transposase InsO family protein
MSHELVRDLIERVAQLEHRVRRLCRENNELREALRVAHREAE